MVCPECDCTHTVDVDKRINLYAHFFEQVEKVKQISPGKSGRIILDEYVEDDFDKNKIN